MDLNFYYVFFLFFKFSRVQHLPQDSFVVNFRQAHLRHLNPRDISAHVQKERGRKYAKMKMTMENGSRESNIMMDDVRNLIKKKDSIEEQIKAYYDVLEDVSLTLAVPR